jgi:Ser/Thr protein kinase RdoA (MazF antagonist)
MDRDVAGGLSAHLAATYGVEPRGLSRLDDGVFRVDLPDESWVARVFATRSAEEVQGDADILGLLGPTAFPAERCAVDEPVSLLNGLPVLVTEYVVGDRPRGGRIYAVLGALMGALHERPGTDLRPGGGWHHIVGQGSPRDEIDVAVDLLGRADDLAARGLIDELDDAVDCADLPHAFVHPDPVPVNAIESPGQITTLVDWAGSGRGPRLWSLAFLLFATGGRPKALELAMSRYQWRITLEPAELDALENVLAARSLLLGAWAVGTGRTPAAKVLAERAAARQQAGEVAAQVRMLTSRAEDKTDRT